MTGRTGRMARVGRLAMWAAAYALVFQAFVTGVLVSAMPVAASPTPLCLSASPTGEAPEGDQDGGVDHYGHCAACLVRADLSGLPPPMPTPVLGRVAIELAFRSVVRRALRAASIRLPLQPRAPPVFA